ncbi:hypothetical protein ASC77_02160 [Nocardioides sp. Root1257]|uniref:DUF5996 family protein n=1 Tax=unclassified Nocardioides TaxID=2615069 RepID=UPI0006F91C38|nr:MULTISPECIES: DUF5996 family protein [unclassified Nocardioides]KQW53126.1 hypothetical protein ASC77_02160 [Nocardioides sp. Root1257]KRC55814.1 hypothetical protein ASE24_02160 [Nocardioides sp. Root224]
MNGHDGRWPRLLVDDWTDTRDTLHRWVQVVGRIRLALSPFENHWWHVPLYVNAIGLTTSLMPAGGRGVEIQFDFVDHRLLLDCTDGRRRTVELTRRSVADFHAEVRARLGELDLHVPIGAAPVEVEDATPFADDEHHASYDPDAAHLFWLSLVKAHGVLSEFRGEFRGKGSPVHFFWGAFDLAVTRFSGRPAARHPGGVPNCPDRVMWEAYCAEVSSAGFWPGGSPEGSFYSYAYPEPPGFRSAAAGPAGAAYDERLGEFLLPYHLVRESSEPDRLVLEFLRSTYDAAARLGEWPDEVTNPAAGW